MVTYVEDMAVILSTLEVHEELTDKGNEIVVDP